MQQVKVGDLTGTWIYSEFDTDAPFDKVSEWVDPRNWPRLAPFMFKKMDVVGSHQPARDSPSRGTTTGTASSTRRSSSSTGSARSCTATTARMATALPAMTFELAFSPDGQLDVDRGYITVTNTGLGTGTPGCRVQALKIVGFTEDGWDAVAQYVCPYWTDFLRAAVRGASSAPKPGDPVAPASRPGPGPGRPRRCVDRLLRRVREDVPRPLRGHEHPCRVREVLALGLACRRVAVLVPDGQGLGAGLDLRTGPAS